MTSPSSRLFWRSFLGFSLALSLLAFYQTWLRIESFDIVLWKSKWVVLLVGYGLNLLGGAGSFVYLLGHQRDALVDRLDSRPQGRLWKIVAVIFLSGGLVTVWVVRWRVFYLILPQAFPALWVFWWSSLLAALGLKWLTRASWGNAFLLVLLVQGVLFVSYGKLRLVSDYPFSLGYSETSRYYYGSLLFARSLYGIQPPLSFLHPTRYFLLALPFLFPGSSLGFERLWQALLWIGLTAGSAWALAWRLRLNRGLALLVAAWFYAYSFQGAVYYHLHAMVIIILLGVWPKHFWRSLMAVLLASIWAGMSRINWFPVPAMLAIALYFLEEPLRDRSGWWRYLMAPLSWGFWGTIAAFLSQAWYIAWSGNAGNPEVFGSSFSSPLLWNRLLPNTSYPLGVLGGISIVSSPLWLAIYFAVRGKTASLHWLRWLGLISMTLVLFIGGLIVSIKIGGGADLHNMDAYMVMLAVIGVYLFSDRVAAENAAAVSWAKPAWPIVLLASTVPLMFAVSNIGPLLRYDRAAAGKDLQTLRAVISQAAGNHGEVLFITERQMLTYHMVEGVPLVPDYELVTLMEMAMSGNTDYLNQFYADLHRQRFALIIARRQSTGIQSEDEGFADENNVWNTMIAGPLLCEYKPVGALEVANVQVYAPRPGADCP